MPMERDHQFFGLDLNLDAGFSEEMGSCKNSVAQQESYAYPTGTGSYPGETYQMAFTSKMRNTKELPVEKIIFSSWVDSNIATDDYANHRVPIEQGNFMKDSSIAMPQDPVAAESGLYNYQNNPCYSIAEDISASSKGQTNSLTILYDGAVYVFNNMSAEKAKLITDMVEANGSSTNSPEANQLLNALAEQTNNSSPRIPGPDSAESFFPTLAMARKATLARFLEKRMHRLMQGKVYNSKGIAVEYATSSACADAMMEETASSSCGFRR